MQILPHSPSDNIRQLTRSWRQLPVEVGPERLIIGKHSVVETWEEPIQFEMARLAAQNGGRILEVGYGLGMASREISRTRPACHWIIEAHPVVAAKAVNELESGAVVINATWQEIVPSINSDSFDGIVFDAYPLHDEGFDGSTASTCRMVSEFLPSASRLLRRDGIFTFLDLSRGLPTFEAFKRKAELHFNSCHSVMIDLNIPLSCSYAKGRGGYVISLIK